MAITATSLTVFRKIEMGRRPRIICRKKERDRGQNQHYPYKVIEVTPPPKNLGIRCFPLGSKYQQQANVQSFMSLSVKKRSIPDPPKIVQSGENVTIEGRAYTVSSVTHRYQLRKGKYEPSEKRLDVLSTGRYILNLYLDNLLEKS